MSTEPTELEYAPDGPADAYWQARAVAAEARVSELESALCLMIDWHERGDMDSTVELHDQFALDIDAAAALLVPVSAPTQSGSTQP